MNLTLGSSYMAYDIIFGRTKRDWSCGSDDPLVWTPSAVKAEMLRILGIVDAVNEDASKAVEGGQLTPAEWNQWHQTYLASHEFLVNASGLWGSNVAVARNHEREANKWRQLITSRGGKVQGPGNLGPQNNPFEIDKWTVALAVGGVAATALLISAIRK